jgi:RHS repeat-associated protein
VSNWTGSAWSKSYEYKFLYDGWNLIATLDSANTLLYSFRWGTDLSGTMQGAGGVGGLISMTVHTGGNAGTYFYAFDGNGNVAALINAADGSVSARYEYGPFGELIRASGPLAFLNPFRFSTKYQDDETGFLYYGYRYYDPSLGRWLSRDPIEERGGINVYGFVDNDPLSWFDGLGLDSNIATGTTFTTDLQGGGQVSVTVGSHLNDAERKLALRAISLVRKLLGKPVYVPYYPDTYWATFSGATAADGLTHARNRRINIGLCGAGGLPH